MDILFLGTGNAFADGGRDPMAILLSDGRTRLLLDCGPSTLPLLKKQGETPSEIEAILLSHHHGDHFAGLPFLILAAHYEGRETPLTVFGPPGTEELIEKSMKLFYPSFSGARFPILYLEMRPNERLTLDTHDPAGASTPEISIESLEADHFSGGVALGYRVSWNHKSVLYSGDTRLTASMLAASDVDLFICECSSFEMELEKHVSHRTLKAKHHEIRARRTVLVHPGQDVLNNRGRLSYELAYDSQRIKL